MRMLWTIRIVILALVAVGMAAPPAPIAAANPSSAAAVSASTGVLAVTAGNVHTCAIRIDGTLACWGWNEFGQATPPAGTFTAVSAGDHHACAIRTDGTLACWGGNWNGQASPPAGAFIAVAAGGGHTCAIRTDGTLACWGTPVEDEDFGQAIAPAGAFTAVAAGFDHTCAIRTDGTLACWGGNEWGQASPPAGTFTAVSAGGSYACAIRTDGTLACWGTNDEGQASPPAGSYTAVSAGGSSACAIQTARTLACWGWTSWGGEATAPSGTFTAVAAGGEHTCAIRTDETLACWGWNGYGQVTPRPTPTLRALPTWLATTAIPLRWSARPALAPVSSYDVRYRRARWNGDFGPTVTWRSATTATGATFTASPGSTYCFSVRARDADGGVSPWTVETCTAIPLDDRSVARSWSWAARTGSAYYLSTYLRSSNYSAKLTRTGVVAKRIALLATTCPTCGSVQVYWGSTLLKTVNLYSKTTASRKLITVVAFPWARSGTLSIRVVSSGKKVIIDGIAIRRN
jgi:hypothetical protein